MVWIVLVMAPVQMKIKKEPMKMLLEGGLEELASVPFDQLDSGDKDVKDDIDLRLKWLGLFHRRKQHCESTPCLTRLPLCRLPTFQPLSLPIVCCSV